MTQSKIVIKRRDEDDDHADQNGERSCPAPKDSLDLRRGHREKLASRARFSVGKAMRREGDG